MPLVTRAGDRGQLFRQATEPGGWLNGDMWVDTDNSNVAVNRSGTAQRIAPGTTAAGDVLFSNGVNTITSLAIGTAAQALVVNSGATAPEWGTITQLWSVLGDYEATEAEASHNFSFTAVDFDDDSKLVLVIDMQATAQLALLLRINEQTGSSYHFDGSRITGGAETLIDGSADSSFTIGSTSVINSADRNIGIIIDIQLAKGGVNDYPLIHSRGEFGNLAGTENVSGALIVNSTNIVDIDILTSTSTWKVGTRATLYKVARA